MSADSYADLLERLFGAYEDRHTIPVIENVVSESRAQLAGQTPPDAHLNCSNDSSDNDSRTAANSASTLTDRRPG